MRYGTLPATSPFSSQALPGSTRYAFLCGQSKYFTKNLVRALIKARSLALNFPVHINVDFNFFTLHFIFYAI